MRLALFLGWLGAGVGLLILFNLTPGLAHAQAPPGGNNMLTLPQERPAAPDFPAGYAWWNTDRPLTLSGDLKGRVVVLDFWTYCCINCIHELANLEKVETHYKGQPVVVIGVHSNKFANEADAEHVRQAILRYRIGHPVVVDQNHTIWRQFGVNAWPTLVFIDPEGRLVGSVAGEVTPADVQMVIDQLLTEGRSKGTLADKPLTLRHEGIVPCASKLCYPGKIVADTDFLFIADSNHDRILITDPTGEIVQTIGSGERGAADGPIAQARFANPQGLALDGEHSHLYVADHDNHLIRRVDLKARTVETVLGTGEEVYDRKGGGHGRAQGINSPWDLALIGHTLYIAMAGTHQIWRMDTQTLVAEPWVGSGREEIVDGPGLNAALAQPSGLTHLGDYLYFADSEVSALRRARLSDGAVDTLIGHGLFDFGDVDGAYGRARLQHPLGVTTDGSHHLFIADTYNHKIKIVYLEDGTVKTLAGAGQPGVGQPGGQLALNEPGGLTWANGKLFIADTNNNRIITLGVEDRRWSELAVRPAEKMQSELEFVGWPVRAEISPEAAQLVLELAPTMVEGFELNHAAPQTVMVWEPGLDYRGALLGENHIQRTVSTGQLPLMLTLDLPRQKPSSGEFVVDLSFATCSECNEKICKPEHRRWRVEWHLNRAAADRPLRLISGTIGVA